MKIWDNGVVREMTPEEIKRDKETDEQLAKLIPPQDGKSIMEEFIERVANADTLSEVKEIAQDIKGRIIMGTGEKPIL